MLIDKNNCINLMVSNAGNTWETENIKKVLEFTEKSLQNARGKYIWQLF